MNNQPRYEPSGFVVADRRQFPATFRQSIRHKLECVGEEAAVAVVFIGLFDESGHVVIHVAAARHTIFTSSIALGNRGESKRVFTKTVASAVFLFFCELGTPSRSLSLRCWPASFGPQQTRCFCGDLRRADQPELCSALAARSRPNDRVLLGETAHKLSCRLLPTQRTGRERMRRVNNSGQTFRPLIELFRAQSILLGQATWFQGSPGLASSTSLIRSPDGVLEWVKLQTPLTNNPSGDGASLSL